MEIQLSNGCSESSVPGTVNVRLTRGERDGTETARRSADLGGSLARLGGSFVPSCSQICRCARACSQIPSDPSCGSRRVRSVLVLAGSVTSALGGSEGFSADRRRSDLADSVLRRSRSTETERSADVLADSQRTVPTGFPNPSQISQTRGNATFRDPCSQRCGMVRNGYRIGGYRNIPIVAYATVARATKAEAASRGHTRTQLPPLTTV